MSQQVQNKRISCLCGKVAQGIDLSLQTPLTLTMCHCDSCRRTSGLLCTSYFDLSSEEPPNFTGLSKYAETENIDRWFCGTCGAHAFLQIRAPKQEKFLVAAGLVQGEVQTVGVQTRCAASTHDGGLASILKGSEKETPLLACFDGIANRSIQTAQSGQDSISNRDQPSISPATPHSTEKKANTNRGIESILPARCHCGGVKFYVTPPNENSKSPTSPWSDLLVPFHSASSDNPDDIKWWLVENPDAEDKGPTKTRYLAGLCACHSSRMASGFPIQAWAFVPLCNIFKSDGSLLLEYDIATLQRYVSSPTVTREFCRICGATVFWHCDWRPGVVDVSVGLFQSRTGVRAETWLKWVTERVSFSEEALDQGLVQCLQSDLKAWGERRADETSRV